MAATIASAPDTLTISMTFQSVTGDSVTKIFDVDGGMSDEDVESLINAIDFCTNALITNVSVSAKRLVSGLKNAASASSQNLVSVFMLLSFGMVHPLNAGKTVRKGFAIPAYVNALNVDNSPNVGTPGTAAATNYLGTIVEVLEESLQYTAIDGSLNTGFEYQPSASGFGTGADVIDGV